MLKMLQMLQPTNECTPFIHVDFNWYNIDNLLLCYHCHCRFLTEIFNQISWSKPHTLLLEGVKMVVTVPTERYRVGTE